MKVKELQGYIIFGGEVRNLMIFPEKKHVHFFSAFSTLRFLPNWFRLLLFWPRNLVVRHLKGKNLVLCFCVLRGARRNTFLGQYFCFVQSASTQVLSPTCR